MLKITPHHMMKSSNLNHSLKNCHSDESTPPWHNGNNELNIIRVTKVVFIAGRDCIAMGSQSHIPCCQSGSAPGSDYSKTVRSPQYELLIFLSSPTWHWNNKTHSARIESRVMKMTVWVWIALENRNASRWQFGCVVYYVLKLPLVSSNTWVTRIYTRKLHAQLSSFAVIFLCRGFMFLFIVILFDTQTRWHFVGVPVPAAHLPQRLPLKLSVHTLWLSQWEIRKWHPCISVSSAWHSESGHQRRWSSGG